MSELAIKAANSQKAMTKSRPLKTAGLVLSHQEHRGFPSKVRLKQSPAPRTDHTEIVPRSAVILRHCPRAGGKLSGKNWTSSGNRASLDPLRERQRLSPGSRPAGSIACAGLRWWRRKRPLQPNKGSQPCLSRSCHQTRPAGRTQSRLKCLRCSTANRARPLPP